jgi:putative membrane protein
MRFVVVSVMAGLAVSAAALAKAQEIGPIEHHHLWGDGWDGMFFGPVMMVVFLAILVVLVVAALRWSGTALHSGGAVAPMAPLDILKQRFARGEIDKEEYEARRRVLSD